MRPRNQPPAPPAADAVEPTHAVYTRCANCAGDLGVRPLPWPLSTSIEDDLAAVREIYPRASLWSRPDDAHRHFLVLDRCPAGVECLSPRERRERARRLMSNL
jgi:hypothetical protein